MRRLEHGHKTALLQLVKAKYKPCVIWGILVTAKLETAKNALLWISIGSCET